jgi:putative chitinase
MALSPTVDYYSFVSRYGAVPPAFRALFTQFEVDSAAWSREEFAYLLATVKHETAGTFQPIEEYFPKPPQPAPGEDPNVARQRFIVNYFDRRYEQEPQRTQLGNLQHGDGYRFRGRGYAQVTGRRNYALFSPLVSVDLIVNPDLALKVDVAYRILTIGSRQGLFTGRKLGDYISANRNDFVNARRVINGVDHAQDIADEANRFYRFLQTSS